MRTNSVINDEGIGPATLGCSDNVGQIPRFEVVFICGSVLWREVMAAAAQKHSHKSEVTTKPQLGPRV